MRTATIATALVLLMTLVAGCGQESNAGSSSTDVSTSTAGDVKSTDAAGLWDIITAEDYLSWDRPAGAADTISSKGPHGDEVDLYINDVVAATGAGASAWPEGSVVVKEARAGGSLVVIAAMWKRDGAWLWAEYEPDGRVIIEGEAAPACAGCHASGQDSVIAFDLP